MKMVFDLGMEWFAAWCFPAFGIIFAILGSLFYLPKGSNWVARALGPRSSCMLFVIFGSVIAGTSLTLVTVPYLKEMRSLKSGNYAIIEGKLDNFHPGRTHPVVNETFVVNGKQFTAVPFALAQFGGFASNPRFHFDNPENLYVRISYLDQTPPVILRLEVRQ